MQNRKRPDSASAAQRHLADRARRLPPASSARSCARSGSRRITDAQLLRVMTPEEIFSEVTAVYDNYVDALETGSVETLQAYARDLSERIIPRGVETHEVLGIVLLLRDVLARSLFVQLPGRPRPAQPRSSTPTSRPRTGSPSPSASASSRSASASSASSRTAIRELSTPVLQVRDRLLILPIIGVLDSPRARQLTEQLLGAIQANRAKVVVIDITGVATIDLTVANHLVQTVKASRLMGASAIITGLSSSIAQTLVDLGVDLEHDADGRRPAGRPRGGRAPARAAAVSRATAAATDDVGPARAGRRSSSRATT